MTKKILRTKAKPGKRAAPRMGRVKSRKARSARALPLHKLPGWKEAYAEITGHASWLTSQYHGTVIHLAEVVIPGIEKVHASLLGKLALVLGEKWSNEEWTRRYYRTKKSEKAYGVVSGAELDLRRRYPESFKKKAEVRS
jgi:hypothetical protein